MIIISPKNNYIANYLEDSTGKSFKLFGSESGASKLLCTCIMYLLMICTYITSQPWPCAMELLITF